MKKIKYTILALALLFTTLYARKPVLPDILNPNVETRYHPYPPPFHRYGPTIQIGILLDTSGSMSGLINQAKDQLWKIVNEVAKANKNNKDVVIQVGLFEYGKSSLPQYEGYLQMLTPLTSDLDKVSEKLFKLRTNGGEEYAGKVILEAVNRFAWSPNKDDMRLIIIAGNESFAQGNVPYKSAIQKAKDNGIIVNTIYCGNQEQGINLHWQDGAKLGKGKYFSINHNDRRVYVPTPYDDKIIALGKKLNSTFLTYGEKRLRVRKKEIRAAQDSNALKFSKTSYIERNLVKAKKQYTQTETDMVALYSRDKNFMNSISKDKLPDELKNKSKKEIAKILEEKRAKRESIQKQIEELETKRGNFIAKNSKESSKDLGSAIIKSIRKEAIEHGFKFKN